MGNRRVMSMTSIGDACSVDDSHSSDMVDVFVVGNGIGPLRSEKV